MFKRGLKRMGSKITGEQKNNKANTNRSSLPSIDDDAEGESIHSSEGTGPTEMEASLSQSSNHNNRRSSVAETIDSTSTGDSKGKSGYMKRLAAQSRADAAHAPWMAMSPMSHSTMGQRAKPKPKVKAKPEGGIKSARVSSENVPNSAVSTSPPSELGGDSIPSITTTAPFAGSANSSTVNLPPHPTYAPPVIPRSRSPSAPIHNGIRSSSNQYLTYIGPPYPHSPTSMGPPSPTFPNSTNMPPQSPPPTGPLPPPPPMHPAPPPPPPAGSTTISSPLGPLSNPFRTETTELDHYAVKPPPQIPPAPPPPPAAPAVGPLKLQRNPSKTMAAPPSAWGKKHQRSFSGSGSAPASASSSGPGSGSGSAPSSSSQSLGQSLPNLSKPDLPILPVPPPPPPAGYYGSSSATFVAAELDGFPQPPTGNPAQRQEHATVQNDRLQAEEDFRENSKVLLPNGVMMHATSESNGQKQNNANADQPAPLDGVLLSHEEHATLMEIKSKLEADKSNLEADKSNLEADLTALHIKFSDMENSYSNSLQRIGQWESYKTSIDKYIEQLAEDRQGLVDKVQSSAQAYAKLAQETDGHLREKDKQLHEKDKQLQEAENNLKTTINNWQNYAHQLDTHRKDMEARHAAELARLNAEHSREIERMTVEHKKQVGNLDQISYQNRIELENVKSERAAEVMRLTMALDTERSEYERQKTETIEQLSAAISEKESMYNQLLEMDTEAAEKKQEKAETKAVYLREQTEALGRTIQEMQAKLLDLDEKTLKVENLQATEATLEKFLATANEEKEKLKSQLKASTAAKGRLGTALSRAEAENNEKGTKIMNLEDENEALKKRIYLLGQRMAEKMEWYQSQLNRG
ncbi:hypothetical protein ABW19_dt0202900 [Dactylella cylindrospora]|nr:hypothetical protein ABW19_dt0202900 [Dactylella cylindrospora]